MKQLEQFNLLKKQHVIGVSPVRASLWICHHGSKSQEYLSPVAWAPHHRRFSIRCYHHESFESPRKKPEVIRTRDRLSTKAEWEHAHNKWQPSYISIATQWQHLPKKLPAHSDDHQEDKATTTPLAHLQYAKQGVKKQSCSPFYTFLQRKAKMCLRSKKLRLVVGTTRCPKRDKTSYALKSKA